MYTCVRTCTYNLNCYSNKTRDETVPFLGSFVCDISGTLSDTVVSSAIINICTLNTCVYSYSAVRKKKNSPKCIYICSTVDTIRSIHYDGINLSVGSINITFSFFRILTVSCLLQKLLERVKSKYMWSFTMIDQKCQGRQLEYCNRIETIPYMNQHCIYL